VDSVQRGVNFAAKVLIYQSQYCEGTGGQGILSVKSGGGGVREALAVVLNAMNYRVFFWVS